jgi:ubiquinone/menaquinone biosynthesis C-methylase UbiE
MQGRVGNVNCAHQFVEFRVCQFCFGIVSEVNLIEAKDLGLKTNIDVLNHFVDLQDLFVVDVGCGAMDFTKDIVSQGARVLAIDPDSAQAELNRAMEPTPGLEFVEADAQQIPAPDKSVDGVFFIYSLHHVPAEIYPTVFAEVFRVLKSDGFLYVIEPTGCPLNDVMMLFHDEEAVRAAAQSALEEIAMPAFESNKVVKYHSIREFDSYEHFATVFSSRTFNPGYSESDVRHPKVQEAFERHGSPDYRFEAPKQVTFLKGLR